MTAAHIAGLAWAFICIAAVARIYRGWWGRQQQAWADVERCRQYARDLFADDLMAVADVVQAPRGKSDVTLAALDLSLWELEFGAEA